MTLAILLILGWVACGWLGYLLTRHYWTSDLDWTVGEHRAALLCAVLGPLDLYIGVLLNALLFVETVASGAGSKRVLKEARR